MSAGLRAGTSNDGYLQINGTDVLTALSSGRIGIGISNPDLYGYGGKLLTVNDTSTYTNLIVASGGAFDSGISFGNQTIRRAQISVGSGSYFSILTNNTDSGVSVTERLRITATGNVGIGTTIPKNRLHVRSGGGTAHPDAWVAGDFIFDGGTAQNTTELTLIGGVYTQVNSVNLNLLTAGNDYGNGLGQRIRVQKDSSGAGGNHSLYIDRINSDGSGNRTVTTLTRHSAAGDWFFNNATSKFIGQCEDAVFIGTTQLSSSNYFVGMETRLGGDRDLVFWSKTGDAGGNIRFRNGYTTNGSVTEKFTIRNDGNVGIGDTNPSTKLSVIGNVYLSGTLRQSNGEQSTAMFSGSQITASNNTWYTVTNFAFQYNLVAFLIFVSLENNAGDGNNTTALFMSPGTNAYAGGGSQPVRISGATSLEMQIVHSGNYDLQLRATSGASGTSDTRLRWWGIAIPGN